MVSNEKSKTAFVSCLSWNLSRNNCSLLHKLQGGAVGIKTTIHINLDLFKGLYAVSVSDLTHFTTSNGEHMEQSLQNPPNLATLVNMHTFYIQYEY